MSSDDMSMVLPIHMSKIWICYKTLHQPSLRTKRSLSSGGVQLLIGPPNAWGEHIHFLRAETMTTDQ